MKLVPLTSNIWSQYASWYPEGIAPAPPKEGIFVAENGVLLGGVGIQETDMTLFLLGLRLASGLSISVTVKALRMIANAARGAAAMRAKVAVFDLGTISEETILLFEGLDYSRRYTALLIHTPTAEDDAKPSKVATEEAPAPEQVPDADEASPDEEPVVPPRKKRHLRPKTPKKSRKSR